MIEFAWNCFTPGDVVKIVATDDELTKIGLDTEYKELNGIVKTSTSKTTLVNFGGNNTRAFYTNMLTKSVDTYNDTPDPDDYSDDYYDAMNAAYGDVE